MEKTVCPMCEMDDVLESPARWECSTCGHEWERSPAAVRSRTGLAVFLKTCFVKRSPA